jgi:hypothetical protein
MLSNLGTQNIQRLINGNNLKDLPNIVKKIDRATVDGASENSRY